MNNTDTARESGAGSIGSDSGGVDATIGAGGAGRPELVILTAIFWQA